MKQQYKILSRNSSHKDDIGDYVSRFNYEGEVFYTLKLKDEGFRSYPIKNLEFQEPKDTRKEVVDKFFKDVIELTRLLERRDSIHQIIKLLKKL